MNHTMCVKSHVITPCMSINKKKYKKKKQEEAEEEEEDGGVAPLAHFPLQRWR